MSTQRRVASENGTKPVKPERPIRTYRRRSTPISSNKTRNWGCKFNRAWYEAKKFWFATELQTEGSNEKGALLLPISSEPRRFF